MNLLLSKINLGIEAVAFTTLSITLSFFLYKPWARINACEKHTRHWVKSMLCAENKQLLSVIIGNVDVS